MTRGIYGEVLEYLIRNIVGVIMAMVSEMPTMTLHRFFSILLAIAMFSAVSVSAQTYKETVDEKVLKIVTINVWSGLDYHGTLDFGEYESCERRGLRLGLLVDQLRKLDPDIVFVQEANPVGEYSSRLADSLGLDEIHQVCNAGIKILGFGPPWNFEEGIAILAKKNFHLREHAVWKLSGSFGLFGGLMSINFDEAEFALAAEIGVDGRNIYLVNVHLSAFPPNDPVVQDKVNQWLSTGKIDSSYAKQVPAILAYGSQRRMEESKALLHEISELPHDVPVILGGDFNAEPSSPEIGVIYNAGEFRDVCRGINGDQFLTWNPIKNTNIAFSTSLFDCRRKELNHDEKLSAIYDAKPRKIDYIFLSRHFGLQAVRGVRIALDSSANGVFASDHFGVAADIDLSAIPTSDSLKNSSSETRASIEPLPIVSYDTDIGFGYGAKLFLYNLLRTNESFDMVAFNSTKGERWYRVVFSIPDFESREGTVYPLAIDLTFDYDKWIENNFFGVGNSSLFSNRKQYTREPIEFDLTLSRGFNSKVVGQINLRHKSIRNFNFENGNPLATLSPSLNSGNAVFSSFGMNLRYDTRNSFVNPSRGVVLQGETEFSPKWKLGNTSFTRLAGWLQYYSILFYPTTIFAFRLGLQQVIGENLPIQVMSSIGGNSNLRGYPQDRYLDRASALVNAELRFQILWRIGGVVGADAGKVWQSLSNADLKHWAFNPVAGLRLYMDNYVVRADFGFGRDGMGFYFNFGQLF